MNSRDSWIHRVSVTLLH